MYRFRRDCSKYVFPLAGFQVLTPVSRIVLMMEAVSISEMSVNFYETARRSISFSDHLPLESQI
jgi:hypothetical protein